MEYNNVMGNSEMEELIASATPEELAEMERLVGDYIAGIDAELAEYNKSVESIVSEGEEALRGVNEELTDLERKSTKEAEQQAEQQAKDSII